MKASMQPGVLPLEQARRIVEEHAANLHARGAETVSLLDALDRVLAEEIRADRDFPPFPRSTRDGYAVRAADVSTPPVRLKVVREIRAGQPRAKSAADTQALEPGDAAEIMTGAPLPDGADAVVMVEYTERHGTEVAILRAIEPGDNFVPQAAEAHCGDALLPIGHRIDHAAIAIAASVGHAELRVASRPRVAILATGDEIVELSAKPAPNQIRNSNTWSLAAQVLAQGGSPILLPVAPDESGRLRQLIAEGLKADLLLVTGGVSMGKYDLVEQALAEFNAEFFFTGAQIQPGKPVVFGRAQHDSNPAYFLGLPGNPVSTMVTFELFARPLIDALSGAPVPSLRFVQARLKSGIQAKPGLTRFLPALLTGEYHNAQVEPVSWKGSGDIAALARANCYVVVPRHRDQFFAEEMIDVLLR